MPISSAISGIEMPGRARTSSSACLERVPLPRGRPRRPPPSPSPPAALRRRGAPAPATAVSVAARCAATAGGAAAAPAPRRRGRVRGRARGGGHPVERRRRGLEALIFVNQRAQLLQPRLDLALLLVQEIGHVTVTVHRPINSSPPATKRVELQ